MLHKTTKNKRSVEQLNHFTCAECKKWWSVSDAPEIKKMQDRKRNKSEIIFAKSKFICVGIDFLNSSCSALACADELLRR